MQTGESCGVDSLVDATPTAGVKPASAYASDCATDSRPLASMRSGGGIGGAVMKFGETRTDRRPACAARSSSDSLLCGLIGDQMGGLAGRAGGRMNS